MLITIGGVLVQVGGGVLIGYHRITSVCPEEKEVLISGIFMISTLLY